DRLAFDLKRYMEGKPVMVPGYARHPDQEASPVEYLWTNPQVLIVEGVPALLKPLNELYWDWSVGLSETKEELENRVRELYAWKGYDAEEINKTWAEKWQAEYEVVSQSLQN